ncbi:MAG: gamma carbonic anhydrase family protein [Chloroflexi bacterium]|nr:gamma carbonic anhydrase family protein [Chloroflexota bacterium]
MLFSIDGKSPVVHETAYVAPTASVIGEVVLEANVSVWFGAVLRGDAGAIRIGEGTNIQDGAILHEETTLGKNCVVAHLTLVHRCVVGERVLIGNGALVFGPCEIGDGCIIGAGAVVTPGTKIPPNMLVLGVPGKPVREVTDKDRDLVQRLGAGYVRNRGRYLTGLKLLKTGWEG